MLDDNGDGKTVEDIVSRWREGTRLELAYAPEHRKHDDRTSVCTSAVRPPGLQVLDRLSAKEHPKLYSEGDAEG